MSLRPIAFEYKTVPTTMRAVVLYFALSRVERQTAACLICYYVRGVLHHIKPFAATYFFLLRQRLWKEIYRCR